MDFRFVVSAGACCFLAGCGGGGSTSTTTSGFAPVAAGSVVTALASRTDNSVTDTAGVIAYAVGFDPADDVLQAQAYAGIETANVGAAGTGAATFNGTYAFGVMENVFRSGTQITASSAQSAGAVTLSVDFNTGALSGTGSSAIGITSDITVNGSVSGRDLAGTVDVNYETPFFTTTSLTTTLDGLVGADGAVGVFHGSDGNSALAGGFVAQ